MITVMPDTIQTALFTTLRRMIARISIRIRPLQNIKSSRGEPSNRRQVSGLFADALSVGYDDVEGLAASSRNCAVGCGPGVPWELEVLVISSIVNCIYCHRNVMSSINFVIEYLSPIEDRLALAVCKMSPQQEPVS